MFSDNRITSSPASKTTSTVATVSGFSNNANDAKGNTSAAEATVKPMATVNAGIITLLTRALLTTPKSTPKR